MEPRAETGADDEILCEQFATREVKKEDGSVPDQNNIVLNLITISAYLEMSAWTTLGKILRLSQLQGKERQGWMLESGVVVD